MWSILLLGLLALTTSQAADFDNFGSGIISPQIVGAQVAKPTQFPWQVALNINTSTGTVFCGGILIDLYWVLTAAHCVQSGLSFEIIAGAVDLKDDYEPGRQKRFISEADRYSHVYIHPGWKGVGLFNLENDIALLYVEERFHRSLEVDTVLIPSKSNSSAAFYGENAVISGWGRDSDSSPNGSDVLRFTENKIISQLYCKFRYLFLWVKDTNICMAGTGGRGACHGDGGGPMVVYDKNDFPIVVGISSFGFGFRCEWGFPSVYTRISSYLDWIKAVSGVSRP